MTEPRCTASPTSLPCLRQSQTRGLASRTRVAVPVKREYNGLVDAARIQRAGDAAPSTGAGGSARPPKGVTIAMFQNALKRAGRASFATHAVSGLPAHCLPRRAQPQRSLRLHEPCGPPEHHPWGLTGSFHDNGLDAAPIPWARVAEATWRPDRVAKSWVNVTLPPRSPHALRQAADREPGCDRSA